MSENGHIVYSQNSKTVQQINTWREEKNLGGKVSGPKEHQRFINNNFNLKQ
jgi:hypothetical protein